MWLGKFLEIKETRVAHKLPRASITHWMRDTWKEQDTRTNRDNYCFYFFQLVPQTGWPYNTLWSCTSNRSFCEKLSYRCKYWKFVFCVVLLGVNCLCPVILHVFQHERKFKSKGSVARVVNVVIGWVSKRLGTSLVNDKHSTNTQIWSNENRIQTIFHAPSLPYRLPVLLQNQPNMANESLSKSSVVRFFNDVDPALQTLLWKRGFVCIRAKHLDKLEKMPFGHDSTLLSENLFIAYKVWANFLKWSGYLGS